jgi:hypothetical protein
VSLKLTVCRLPYDSASNKDFIEKELEKLFTTRIVEK